ncbi:MAG: DUF1893 domain-containing protein [Atribacterota bacterium]
MSDLEKAKNLLKDKQYSFVALAKGNILKASHKRGVLPLMEMIRDSRDMMQGAVIADKVIGKAAALLAVAYKVKQVYTEILSQQAKKVLDQYSIFYQYERCVDYIQNRSKSGQCPMEKLTKDTNDPKTAYSLILKYYLEVLKIDLS